MRIYVERPNKNPKKVNFFKGEWLKSETTRDDMAAEAMALLSDSRDTICRVKIWDDRHGQFEPATFAAGWSDDGTHKLMRTP